MQLNKILKIGTVFLVIVCLLAFSLSVWAFSDTNVLSFNCPISRPSQSVSTRYMEVVSYYNGTYLYNVIVYEFTTTQFTVLIPTINDSSITVYYYGNEAASGSVRYSCFYLSNDGALRFKEMGNVFNETRSVVHTFTGNIVGVHYYGFDVDDDSFLSNQQEFVINYGSDGLQVGFLKSIFNAISNLNIRDYTNALNYISQYLENIDYTTADLYEALRSSNEYLSSIQNILSNPSSSDEIPDYPVKPNPMNPNNPSSPYDPFEYAPPRQDGQQILDDIEDLESEILGDKTSEEIRDEIKDNVDFESKKEEFAGEDIETPSIIEMEGIEGDNNTVVVYNNVFDIVFDCAGGKYRTFLLFNLSIGFAAFVLGRRYT